MEQTANDTDWMLADPTTKRVVLTSVNTIMIFESRDEAAQFSKKHGVPPNFEPTLVKSMVAH